MQPLPKSSIPGIIWPPVPTIPHAMTEALLSQLDKSQWWPADRLQHWQLRQLTELISFAARTVPFYRLRLQAYAAPKQSITIDQWRSIPLLSRANVQKNRDALVTKNPLQAHGRVSEISTSGSTGEPLSVKLNAVARQMASAISIRDYLSKRFDPAGKFAVIRRISQAEIDAGEPKARPWFAGYESGPLIMADLDMDAGEALDWLDRERPDYLMTYPTYLHAMVREAARRRWRPKSLRSIVFFAEVAGDDIRALCQEAWGIPIQAHYSAQEIGPIAFEHPDGGDYLVQAEAVFLEVLRNDGMPCEVGEVGQVVLTRLHNFTMPLIRYAIGDYAEVGPPSPCGRGLPTLRRVLGRSMNLLALPSGKRRYIQLPRLGFDAIGPLRQVQLVQKTLHDVVLKAVVVSPLTPDEESRLHDALRLAIGDDFAARIEYVDDIPREKGGKYMDIVSEIANE